jgi:hypothetical protein
MRFWGVGRILMETSKIPDTASTETYAKQFHLILKLQRVVYMLNALRSIFSPNTRTGKGGILRKVINMTTKYSTTLT